MAARSSPVVTETVSAASSRLTETASSWLAYLTAPSGLPPPELPTPEEWVMAALLEDGRTVNLGDARFYPVSRTYRLVEGSLSVAEETLGLDGVYTTDSGRYRILAADQFEALKKLEAQQAASAAAAAISSGSPLAPIDAAAVQRAATPTAAMAALSVVDQAPAPVGCSAHAKMSTLIAVGPSNVDLAARRAKSVADMARANNNVVTFVVLGVANDAEAAAALALPTPRVFLAGANELRALGSRAARGAIRLYLREAVLLAFADASSLDDGAGAWMLPASSVPLDGTLAALEPRGDLSFAAWKRALNAQWRSWYARFHDDSAELDTRDTELLRAYTSFPRVARHPPLVGFPAGATALLHTLDGPPFGLIDHAIAWTPGRSDADLWPLPCERWACAGRGGASVYWSACSWCHNTQAAMRAGAPALDAQLTLDDLQYDVMTTLATLLTHTRPGGAQPYKARLESMHGVLGPVVLAGRASNEPMRVTWWTLKDAPSLLVLLPEAYVRAALPDYAMRLSGAHDEALLASSGLLALAAVDELPIQFAGLTDVELDGERTVFGPRIWAPTGSAPVDWLKAAQGIPDARDALVVYRTQQDAEADRLAARLAPGQRVGGFTDHLVFYTSSHSDDQLDGLRVRWAFAAGQRDKPTLDVDTHASGRQLPYERFL